MYKFLCFLFFTILSVLHCSAQFTHGGRGMYVDKFFRTSLNTSGATIVNQAHSILSVQSKEDSLLKYAKENHFTYLILYDLYYVFGNATYEGYLCSFIQKAKTQYCIEYVGVASSCSGLFDDIFGVAPSPAINFADGDNSIRYSEEDQTKLGVVRDEKKPTDPLFYESEITKMMMRMAAYNDGCSGKLDVMVTEYEFWNTGVDDCVGDSPTRDVKFTRYQSLVNNMDVIRDNYNTSHSGHQLYVETYLGYLHLNTAYAHQTIADWIDGSYNGKRRVDRINTHYYGSDPTKLYSRTATGQNNSGYYLTRFLDFCQPTTNNQTNMLPIYSSEYIPWGSGATFLGSWFSQNVNNNIFTAEKYFYNDWYDDAQNYHQSTVGSATLGTMVKPGGVLWFTSSKLLDHVNRPLMFTSNSPVCVASGQNGTFQFQYQGPIEQGVSFKFYLTNAGTSTLRCGTTNSIVWPAYNPATQTSIDLNAALGGCTLPAGDYDAHLELTYASGCTAYIAPLVRVSVVNGGKIVALTPTTVCQGNPVYLQANSSGGGTTTYAWYDGTTAISGATSSTYAPNAASTGAHNYSCLITSSVSGCSANRSNIIPVTINTYPTATITTQSTSSCSITIQGNPTGGSYVWHDGSTGPTYSTNVSGTYSVAVTVNGCTSLSPRTSITAPGGSGSVIPTVSITSSTGSTICVGTNVVFTATPVNGGSASYQWKKNGANVGTNSNTYSNSTLANGEIISCVMTSSLACATPTTATSNNIIMVVNQLVAPYVTISSNTGNLICAGTNVTFTATPTNGGTTPAYQWKKNGVSVGTNSNVFSDNTLLQSDVITCTLTSNAACPVPASITSSSITMTVNPVVVPAVTIASNSGSSICSGSNVTFTATPVNGGSATYQWKKNGNNVGTNSNTFSDNTLINGDVISCVMTSSAMCATPATATSNSIAMTVGASVTPAVSISCNLGSSICTGNNAIFTAVPVNGGASPVYQWKKNGNNVGTNSNTYSNSTLANGEIISCVITSNASCASPVSATSNAITMTVNSLVAPFVSISANTTNVICAATNVTFTATPTNGGSTPVFQWKKNGNNVGTNSNTYQDNALLQSDIINCSMTSNAPCATTPTVTSSNIVMTVYPFVTPTVLIGANPGNTICSGNNVTFTATPFNGGVSPSYQWKKNGIIVGSNNNTYSDNTLITSDLITCTMTSNALCLSAATAASNGITMNVIPIPVPSVTITANTGNTICVGTSVTFTATPVNGGSSPSYQWKKNGNNVGANSSTYVNSTLANGEIISCVLTSNATCSFPSTATSNSITMNVNSLVAPFVSISANTGNLICAGTNVTFTATPTNGGTIPVFQWKKNGSNVGTNSTTYSDNSLATSDIINCTMTGNAVCATVPSVTSSNIIMTVNASVTPAVTINVSGGNIICAGSNVTFTAVPANGGTTPSYQWKVNGTNAGINSNTFSTATLSNNDVVTCVMTSNATCVSVNSATSNPISLTVNVCGTAMLNLKLFIQGYYQGSNTMIAAIDQQNHPTLCDTVTVELHYATTPYSLFASVKDTININGDGVFRFPYVMMNQDYFIVVKHRNALETWSGLSLLFNSSTMSYDFTNAVNKAYGNNMADLADGNFALWSGDVSNGSMNVQDGVIDNSDHQEIENAVKYFITGYNRNDLTGDGIIESADFTLVEYNDVVSISVMRP